MRVSVKLLATYRKLLPEGATGNTCIIEIPDDSSYTAVLAYFSLENDEASVILVNGRTPDPQDRLSEGDVVCIFPSMAGG
jgi:molybdopterin converting factor small subunit